MSQKAITITIGENQKYHSLSDYLAVLNQAGWILDAFAYLPNDANTPFNFQEITIVAHRKESRNSHE